jgi:hypothetical protein
MRSNLIELNLRDAMEELSAMKPALSSSIGRFARDLEARNRRNQRPRTAQRSTRLPGPPAGRVVAHRGASPQRVRTRIPATAVQRQRMLAARRRGGLSPAEAIQEAVGRLPDTIRNGLLALQHGFARAQRGFQVGPRVVQANFGAAPRRGPPIGPSEQPLLPLLAIVAAVAIGLNAIAQGAGPPTPAFASQGPDDKVRILAQAIATAEGYYAPGERDGRSLPYRLNNPGSLKKPALRAESLPTWKDTGLVVFPTERMGWDALKHQIELMFTGRSSIYDPSDSILDVAKKYADGDLNWGRNVARQLGISPSCSLDEIAGGRPNCSLSGDVPEPNRLQLADNAP